MHAVFHLFTFEDQKRVVDRCIRLFEKVAGRPVLLPGAQVDNVEAGEWRSAEEPEFTHDYRHNDDSSGRLWEGCMPGRTVEGEDANLDVRSRSLSRAENEEEKTGQVVEDEGMRRQVFEIRITFR